MKKIKCLCKMDSPLMANAESYTDASESDRIAVLSDKIDKLNSDVAAINARLGTNLGQKATAAKSAVGRVADATRSAANSAASRAYNATTGAVGTAYEQPSVVQKFITDVNITKHDAATGFNKLVADINETRRARRVAATVPKVGAATEFTFTTPAPVNENVRKTRVLLENEATMKKQLTEINKGRDESNQIVVDNDNGDDIRNAAKKYTNYEYLVDDPVSPIKGRPMPGYYEKGKLYGYKKLGGTRKKNKKRHPKCRNKTAAPRKSHCK